MDVPDRRRPHEALHLAGERRALRWVVAAVLLGIVTTACVLLADSQRRGERELEDRFAARGALSAEFVSAYATQLLDREETVALATLSGATPQRPFDSLVAAFGFQAAVLLDDGGRVLAVSPAKPSLIGKEVASGYPHLRAAVAGTRAISPVVPSAAEGEPVVGFAVPFMTAGGRRVLSGAFTIRDTPLQSYLDGFSTLPGYRAVILDEAGMVVSANGDRTAASLDELAPELVARVDGRSRGVTDSPRGRVFFAAHDIPGTPWRLVTEVPVDTLLAPVNGTSRVLPWVILGGLVLAGGAAFLLGLRLIDGRRRLEAANARLDELASLDALTGVANRRRTVEVLHRELARCAEHALPVSVLLVDVDHFKRVNDTFGHASGDEVLREVVVRVERALRDGDVLGRWGGEEFLVVLPATELFDARAIAERLREVVAGEPVALGTGGDAIDVTVSIGVASSSHAGSEVLVHTADRALYAAKAAGRNLVIASTL